MSEAGIIPAAMELRHAEALGDVPAAEPIAPDVGDAAPGGWTPAASASATAAARPPLAVRLASAIPWRTQPTAAPWAVPPLPLRTEAGPVDMVIAFGALWGAEIMMGLIAAGVALLRGRVSDIEHVLPLAVMVANVNTIVTCWLFACWKYGKGLGAGLALRRVGVLTMLAAMAIGAAMAFGAGHLALMFPPWIPTPPRDAFTEQMWLVAIIFVPLFEEIYFRGFLYSILGRSVGAWPAVFIVTGWFAAAHYDQFISAPITIPILTLLSFLLTWLRMRTNSVIPSILLHQTYNTLLVLLPFGEG